MAVNPTPIDRGAEILDATAIRSISAAQFVANYRTPDEVIEGMIQQGFVYALTGKTGHGKTALSTHFEIAITQGFPLAGRMVKRGPVLSLVGENPTDKQARIIAACQDRTPRIQPPETLRVIERVFNIRMGLEDLERDAKRYGTLTAVVVDTSAAYFPYDDEIDNVQARNWASVLRDLTTLPGRPAVIVLCHPTKAAHADTLIPRGGGAFLNEIDGNLTCWLEGDAVTLHWQGKLRGAGFEPLTFGLKRVALDGYHRADGRPMESVVATAIDEREAEQIARAEWTDGNRLLFEMLQAPDGTQASWARACAWQSPAGVPHKSKVHRLLGSLEDARLVRRSRGRWALTKEGKSEAEKCR